MDHMILIVNIFDCKYFNSRSFFYWNIFEWSSNIKRMMHLIFWFDWIRFGRVRIWYLWWKWFRLQPFRLELWIFPWSWKNWIYFLFKNWFIFEMDFQNHYKIELGSKSMPIGMNSMSWGYFDSAWYEHGPFVTLFSSLMPRTAHTASQI